MYQTVTSKWLNVLICCSYKSISRCVSQIVRVKPKKKKKSQSGFFLGSSRLNLTYDGYFIQQLKILTPATVKSSLKGGSVRAPPAVSMGVQTLLASNLSAQTHTEVRILKKRKETNLTLSP